MIERSKYYWDVNRNRDPKDWISESVINKMRKTYEKKCKSKNKS